MALSKIVFRVISFAVPVLWVCVLCVVQRPSPAAAADPAPVVKETIAGVEVEFVYVPGGEFTMGNDDGRGDEKPAHQVKLRGFYLARFELTRDLWRKVVEEAKHPDFLKNPSAFPDCADCPVDGASFKEVVEFLEMASGIAGKTLRLPTEAEWEYAAGGGARQKWAGTDDEAAVPDYAWYRENAEEKTHPVGQKKPNALGLYDMSGNVWEWCRDWYLNGYYASSPLENPPGPEGGHAKSLRGGSWANPARTVRAAMRHRIDPGFRGINVAGFRMAMDAP